MEQDVCLTVGVPVACGQKWVTLKEAARGRRQWLEYMTTWHPAVPLRPLPKWINSLKRKKKTRDTEANEHQHWPIKRVALPNNSRRPVRSPWRVLLVELQYRVDA